MERYCIEWDARSREHDKKLFSDLLDETAYGQLREYLCRIAFKPRELTRCRDKLTLGGTISQSSVVDGHVVLIASLVPNDFKSFVIEGFGFYRVIADVCTFSGDGDLTCDKLWGGVAPPSKSCELSQGRDAPHRRVLGTSIFSIVPRPVPIDSLKKNPYVEVEVQHNFISTIGVTNDNRPFDNRPYGTDTQLFKVPVKYADGRVWIDYDAKSFVIAQDGEKIGVLKFRDKRDDQRRHKVIDFRGEDFLRQDY